MSGSGSKRKRTIPDILKAIRETSDLQETIRCENEMACMLAVPVMLVGIILNFTFGYKLLYIDRFDSLFNSLFLFVLAALFEVIRRVPMSIKMETFLISFLLDVWFIFVLGRMYSIVGPSSWMIACILLIYSMSRIKNDMTLLIGGTVVLAALYAIINPEAFRYETGTLFYIPHTVLLIVFILLLWVVYNINSARYSQLNKQLKAEVDQKKLLYHLAYHDVLTKLPNRKMFMEQLDLMIENEGRKNIQFYVFFLDIDSFKKINDTLGHTIGDLFLYHIASRLKMSVHQDDLVGRMGGDEFAVLINRNLDQDEIFREAERIKNSILEPFRIKNNEIRTSASIGIAAFPDDGTESSELIKCADTAMYKAKDMGKNNIQFFNKYMQEEIIQQIEMENQLIKALENQEFYLEYQPQFSAHDCSLRGIETLVRWNSPELGTVRPMDFIPLAEDTRLILPIGEWIMKKACQTYKSLRKECNSDFMVSINISTVQFMDDGFIDTVSYIIRKTGMRPENLEFEITENVLIESFEKAVDILKRLKTLGIRIALDDFGTGYSSLSYLKLLPVDTIKIDKSFVDDISSGTINKQIVGALISLGHNLDTTVIVEGVETKGQLEYLKKYHCDYIQGFLLAKPMGESELKQFLSDVNQQPDHIA